MMTTFFSFVFEENLGMRVSAKLFLLLVALLLPTATFAQEACQGGHIFRLSNKLIETKETLPDGTVRTQSETEIALCVDQKVRDEIIAVIRHGREVSEATLAGLTAAIRTGKAGVRVVSNLGGTTFDKGKTVATSSADLTTEVIAQLASGARWVWQVYATSGSNETPATTVAPATD